jgi:hypothetical protein
MTIFGWDMSHFDAPSVGTAISEGIAFITHKAGGDSADQELGTWWDVVRNLDPASVLLGAYWVLYPGSPAARAAAFLIRLDAQCPGWRDRPFILQADCEKWNGDQSTVPSKAEIAAFCDQLVSLVPKLRPVVYAPKWVYGDSLTGLGYPLWASSYVTGAGSFRGLYPGDQSSKWGTYSGQTPAILQYTSSATIGGQTTCDANAFRGTLEQLTALVAPGWSTDMDLTPENLADIADKVVMTVRNTRKFLSDTQLLYIADRVQANIDPRFAALGQAVATLAASVADDATREDITALLAAVEQVDENVMDKLTKGTVDETATALAAALGSRATAVAQAILAAHPA